MSELASWLWLAETVEGYLTVVTEPLLVLRVRDI